MRWGRAGVLAAVAGCVWALFAVAPTLGAAVEGTLPLAIPSSGHGYFYEVVSSGKLPPGTSLSSLTVTPSIGNLSVLPANVRAAYAESEPTATPGGGFADVTWVAINYPTNLGSLRQPAQAATASDHPSQIDLVVKFVVPGKGQAFDLKEGPLTESCAAARAGVIDREGSYPLWGTLGPWTSTPQAIFMFTAADCLPPPQRTGCDASLDVIKNLDSVYSRFAPDLVTLPPPGRLEPFERRYATVETPPLPRGVNLDRSEWLRYDIAVVNRSACPAENVVLRDLLPSKFRCFGEHINGATTDCRGDGAEVTADLGTLAPHATVHVTVSGKFIAIGSGPDFNNVATVHSDNASEESSDRVVVDVVGGVSALGSVPGARG